VNYGIHISASGALAAMYRQDVFANNLANMDTTGFKPDVPAAMHRDPARVEDGLAFMPSSPLLERLGAGALSAPNRVSYTQGALEATGQPFDLALQGDGFFVVRLEVQNNSDRLRLTRDGRFTRDASGRLVMASSGLAVLDTRNSPIQIPDGPGVRVDADGAVRQGDRLVARLRVVNVPDRDVLVKEGHSLFRAPSGAMDAARPSPALVRQGFLEMSGVDAFRAMMQVTSAGREVDGSMSLIAQHDRMMERAINTLGRVT
jgi:flagellar basal body rod protein FlgG